MTAWTPVSEAAALLGVSERTIWRRIKSESIDSRSENGRTLVKLEHDEEADGPLRQMSSVAAAQLSMRKLDVDGISEVLSMVRDYRGTLELNARRARRSGRISAFAAVAALACLITGGWYYMNNVRLMEDKHARILADMRVLHASELAEHSTQIERDSALATDRGRQVEHLQRLTTNQRAELDQVAISRKQFTDKIDTRLAEFSKVATVDKTTLANRDKRVSDLRSQVVSLEERISRMGDSTRRVRDLKRKYTEAVRRAASHSRGLAKGLQIHLAYQKEIERQLRRELALAGLGSGALADASGSAGASAEAVREELLNALVNRPRGGRRAYLSADDPVVGWRLIWRHVQDAFDEQSEKADTEIVLVD